MPSLNDLKAALPEETKDLRLNLDSVLRADKLDRTQTFAVALTSALFLEDRQLSEALLEEGRDVLSTTVVTDAKAAAAIMAMNTVYYRFRHMVGKESYSQKPAGLRMNRMVRPATSKALFEPLLAGVLGPGRLPDVHPARTRPVCSRRRSPRTRSTRPCGSRRS